VRLALKFAAVFFDNYRHCGVSVVVYAEFENTIEVDWGRNVIFDFGI